MRIYRITSLFLLVLAITSLFGEGCYPSRRRCETDAIIVGGVDPDKPGPGKIVRICPGEPVGIAWGTSSAQSASIEPDVGEVGLEGLVIVHPNTTTTYTLTAQGESCSDTDEMIVVVTQDGDIVTLTFSPPPTDKDTGFPVDLIWRTSVDPAFVSGSVVVTDARLVSAGQWPKWQFEKLLPNGGGQQLFTLEGDGWLGFPAPFPAIGQWRCTPIDVPGAVAIADFSVTVEVRISCH